MKRGRPSVTSHDIIKEYAMLEESAYSCAKSSHRNYMRALRATRRLEKIDRWFKLVKPDLTFYQIQAFKESHDI